MNAACFNSGFCGDKERGRCIKYLLSRNGFPAIAICGDKVQKERERALKSFKNGTSPILVATDIASCGLDIPHVAHFINFEELDVQANLVLQLLSSATRIFPLQRHLLNSCRNLMRKFLLGSTNLLRDQLGLAKANITGQAGLVAMTTEMLNPVASNAGG